MMGLGLLKGCILAALGAPALLLVVLAVPSFLARPWKEDSVRFFTQSGFLVCFGTLLSAGVLYAVKAVSPVFLPLGTWFSKGGGFAFDLIIDGWSLGFSILAVGICGVVSAFSFRYLHREDGFHRYFILLVCFVWGILLVALAGSIEVLFAGWEFLGLSSALLVAFFHDRPAPVDNGFRVLAYYRVGDACMLAAAVLLHHWSGNGSLALLFSGSGVGVSRLAAEHVATIAILLIAAAAAKSALLPFSGWLPRAMEGPTPSSAVYYGAVSIHAGCYLLLRASPLILHSTTTRLLAGAAGIATAGYAALVGRAQTDVKSRLCFASLTQVGIIVAEIALGWNRLAFLHMIGNASLRLLQFLSAPNILHDLHELENDLGEHLPAAEKPPAKLGRAIYLMALERGFLDCLTQRWVTEPMARLASALGVLDRWLSFAPVTIIGGDRDDD